MMQPLAFEAYLSNNCFAWLGVSLLSSNLNGKGLFKSPVISTHTEDTSAVCCSDSYQDGLGIRTPESGLGPLRSLGTAGTPGKEGEDFDLSGPGD